MNMNDTDLNNFISLMIQSIEIFKTGGIDAVNEYLKLIGLPEIPKELQQGYLQELERAWMIMTFWNDDLYKLMKNDKLYNNKQINFVKSIYKAYEVSGIDGLRFHINIVYDIDVDDKLLEMIEDKCKKYIQAEKFFNSMPQREMNVGDEKIKVVDAFVVYNFLDTDLSYEEWIEENKDILLF